MSNHPLSYLSESGIRWGFIGWKTLHSYCILYPDNPSITDQNNAKEWLKCFQVSITCPKCKEHFQKLIEQFSKQMEIFKNRHSFFWFSVKAHNVVNARLGKTQMILYREAFDMFQNKNYQDMRNYYFYYVEYVGSLEQGVEAFKINKSIKIMKQHEQNVINHWLSITDWNHNSIINILTETPNIQIDLPVETTKNLAYLEAKFNNKAVHQIQKPLKLRFGFSLIKRS